MSPRGTRWTRTGALTIALCSRSLLAGAAVRAMLLTAAAAELGVDAVTLQHLQAGPDHPVALAAPEGEYLKGLLLMRN
jgi:23S rRNA (cytosine1962-C5)-methyltransferase